MPHAAPCVPGRPELRPRLEIADIFRVWGAAYRASHVLSTEQRRAMHDLETCRTAARGGHLDVCDSCGHERPAYNSCRNRHCPKCQALAQDRWLAGRLPRILPTHYFHVVFTVPAELRGLAVRNRELVFGLIFDAAAATLLTLAHDPKRLGGQIGFTAVLHTWTRDLRFHPHLHCIVTGGGLAPAGDRWIPARRRYLFPLRVIGALFRGKLLAALRDAHDARRLDLGGPHAPLAAPGAFATLLERLHHLDWLPYVKPAFAGPRQIFEYLGRYTHRTGISNRRLLAHDEAGVTFATKNGKTATLAPPEFIRRFLLHVLPARFVKIRHYGLMAPANAATRLEVARTLLQTPPPPATPSASPADPPARDWRDRLLRLTGIDLQSCPRCGTGRMVRHALPPSSPTPASRDTS